MFLSHKYYSLIFVALLTAGCSAQFAFRDINQASDSPNSSFGNQNFVLAPTVLNYTQDSYPQNKIKLEFQAFDGNNLSLPQLTKDMIFLSENNIPVNQYHLSQQSTGSYKEADIVIVLDVTTSMDPSIDKVKSRIGGFVQTLAKSNIKARLCLVEFGESTEKVCDRFIEDNPLTTQNENYDAFIKELNSIITHGGGSEPDENQLPALEAAAQKTPWHPGSERVAILITDAGFHYAPDNIGEGKKVPYYKDSLKIIKDHSMQTFVISDYKQGYSAPLNTMPALPDATGGKFYYLWDILSGKKDMADIFNNIASHLSSSYVIEYIIEQNAGLDPTLPFPKRDIKINIPLAKSIKIFNISSDQPQGHPHYRNRFSLGSLEFLAESLVAFINQKAATDFQIDGQDIVFDIAPEAAAQIQLGFLFKDLKENLNYKPFTIVTTRKTFDLNKLKITANSIELNKNQYQVSFLTNKTFSLKLNDDLFKASEDPLDIKKMGGLTVNYEWN